MRCGASRRGGVLGIELITTTQGKIYNKITDDETHVDKMNLNPLFGLPLANRPEMTGDCWWDVVVAARVLLGASRAFLCTYVKEKEEVSKIWKERAWKKRCRVKQQMKQDIQIKVGQESNAKVW